MLGQLRYLRLLCRTPGLKKLLLLDEEKTGTGGACKKFNALLFRE